MREAVEQLPSVTPQTTRWIPVSERLPEDGRAVLIYAWSVHHVIARYDTFRTENGYKKTWVTADAWNGNTEIRHEVIAWMPLPEPYEVIEWTPLPNPYEVERMTNQQWLATIPPEEWLKVIDWLYHEYGKGFTDSETAIKEWLNSDKDRLMEVENEDCD